MKLNKNSVNQIKIILGITCLSALFLACKTQKGVKNFVTVNLNIESSYFLKKNYKHINLKYRARNRARINEIEIYDSDENLLRIIKVYTGLNSDYYPKLYPLTQILKLPKSEYYVLKQISESISDTIKVNSQNYIKAKFITDKEETNYILNSETIFEKIEIGDTLQINYSEQGLGLVKSSVLTLIRNKENYSVELVEIDHQHSVTKIYKLDDLKQYIAYIEKYKHHSNKNK